MKKAQKLAFNRGKFVCSLLVWYAKNPLRQALRGAKLPRVRALTHESTIAEIRAADVELRRAARLAQLDVGAYAAAQGFTFISRLMPTNAFTEHRALSVLACHDCYEGPRRSQVSNPALRRASASMGHQIHRLALLAGLKSAGVSFCVPALIPKLVDCVLNDGLGMTTFEKGNEPCESAMCIGGWMCHLFFQHNAMSEAARQNWLERIGYELLALIVFGASYPGAPLPYFGMDQAHGEEELKALAETYWDPSVLPKLEKRFKADARVRRKWERQYAVRAAGS